MNKGFTLIEVLVYIALVSLLLSGMIVSTYHLLESSNRIQQKVAVLQELYTALETIEYVLRQDPDVYIFLEDGNVFVEYENTEPIPLTVLGVLEGAMFERKEHQYAITLSTRFFTWTKTVWLP